MTEPTSGDELPITPSLIRLGQSVFADALLAPPDSESHSVLISDGPRGMKKITLNMSENEAEERNSLRYIKAFLVASEAEEAVLLGFSLMTLVEADGTPVYPPTHQKAARLSHWSPAGESSRFAKIIHRGGHNPTTGEWEALPGKYRFEGRYTTAVREGLIMARKMSNPQYENLRAGIDAIRAALPSGKQVPQVLHMLIDAEWIR